MSNYLTGMISKIADNIENELKNVREQIENIEMSNNGEETSFAASELMLRCEILGDCSGDLSDEVSDLLIKIDPFDEDGVE